MIKIDYLIIGQGISGSFLSYFLLENGASLKIIDDAKPFTASRIASGMINPVTGRIVVTTWLIQELIPFALKAYGEMGKKLNDAFIVQKDILTLPPSQQMEDALAKRILEKNSYIETVSGKEAKSLQENFQFYFEPKKIKPALLVDVPKFLAAWHTYLQKSKRIENKHFDFSQLKMEQEGISYQNIQARKIIFCSGINTFAHAPWKNLPYTLTKGEALIAEIPALNRDYLYKSGTMTLAPWAKNQWWIGSSFEHQFEDALPSARFRRGMETGIKNLLKVPFQIIDHVASVRPGCMERRPFVGLHPHIPSLAILNGMGTKGCSLAPFFAKQLADHLTRGIQIEPLADVARFEKVLRRK